MLYVELKEGDCLILLENRIKFDVVRITIVEKMLCDIYIFYSTISTLLLFVVCDINRY